MRRQSILIIAVLVLLAAAGAYAGFGRGPLVTAVPVTRGTAAEIVYATGGVEPVTWAKVASLVRGRIAYISHCESETLKKGAVLSQLDDSEAAYIDETGIRMLSPEKLHTPDALVAAVAETGADAVYVHIDLDVLDPGAISGVQFPEPFGLEPDELVAVIRALRSRFELAGAGITEFAPRSPDAASDDLPVILRVLGALTRPNQGC